LTHFNLAYLGLSGSDCLIDIEIAFGLAMTFRGRTAERTDAGTESPKETARFFNAAQSVRIGSIVRVEQGEAVPGGRLSTISGQNGFQEQGYLDTDAGGGLRVEGLIGPASEGHYGGTDRVDLDAA
jgi:hypothetical protein